jgi:small subunit ribosomal protein S6
MTTDVRIDKSRATDYETTFILRADIDADASERVISRVVNAIEQQGGKLLKVESWGKRRLAFPIAKQRKGFYVYVRFLGYRGVVAEVERNLRMLDTVLRHMTIQLRKDIDPASVAVDPEEVKVRRIEITEAEEEREDSVEASLGLADDQRRERRERPEVDLGPDPTVTPPPPPASDDNAPPTGGGGAAPPSTDGAPQA